MHELIDNPLIQGRRGHHPTGKPDREQAQRHSHDPQHTDPEEIRC